MSLRPSIEAFVGGSGKVSGARIDDARADLERALASRRRLVLGAVITGLAVAASIGWRAAASGGLAPNVAPLLGLAACGLLLSFAWVRHQDATNAADELILAGLAADQDSVAGRSIVHRLRRLDSSRYREGLAAELRWQLRLADEAASADNAGMRPRRISTLNSEQRRALIADRAHVTTMANIVEAEQVDPRALILLWRAGDSSPMSAVDDPESGATLARRLRQSWTLINHTEDQPVHTTISSTSRRAAQS